MYAIRSYYEGLGGRRPAYAMDHEQPARPVRKPGPLQTLGEEGAAPIVRGVWRAQPALDVGELVELAEVAPVELVITSYSIHYTKLYEARSTSAGRR